MVMAYGQSVVGKCSPQSHSSWVPIVTLRKEASGAHVEDHA